MSRFTVANILALIAVLAVGLAAMRDGSDLTERAVFTLTLVALFVGLVGSIVRRGEGAWVGFAVFGWGYCLLAFVPAISREVSPHLLTTGPLNSLVDRLSPPAAKPPIRPQINNQFMKMIGSPKNLLMYANGSPDSFHRSILSADEQKTLDDYVARYRAYQAQNQTHQDWWMNAERIGHSLLALAFALIGAMLGRALSARRDPGVATSPVTTAVDVNRP